MRDALKSVFDNDYQGYPIFLDKVIRPIFGDELEVFPVKDDITIDIAREALKKANIRSIYRVAQIDSDTDVDVVEVFDVTLEDNANISRSRVGIQRIIRSRVFQFTHAFMIFHYENPEGRNWRFSYAYKRGTQADTTEAKRYTYLFGKNLHCRTAIDRFVTLAGSKKDNKALLEAFSVEALSDEFFDTYRKQYAKFVRYITGKEYVKEGSKWVEKQTGTPNEKIFSAFGNNEKTVRDYIKKLMGRITFLHFLQRKGWLCGDYNYMLNLFKKSNKKDDYLDAVLEPLFFGILNTKPEKRKALFAEQKWDSSLLKDWAAIPYLNGGLFEADDEDSLSIKFPKDFFSELLEFYSEYNFTVDENDPDDAEVGVDPEMLGKIFENLLEDNKDKGAFYTPKEIVRYMCQESLIAYLVEKSGIEEAQVRAFVTNPYEEAEKLTEKDIDTLFDALVAVKICDPAIGSGAFPMGLLNELVRCEEALVLGKEENKDRAHLKKLIIKNNIYGVDIEKGAIDIARLRFWLSLVVDEDTPSPLPNLDYKIMQGNSLLESYKGLDLSHILDGQDGLLNFGESIREELNRKIEKYYSCTDHQQKKQLQHDINELVHQQIVESGQVVEGFENIDVAANQDFFLWHTWFSDVFNRPSDCNSKPGFDIVIGNPPYLESRSPEFSDWLKDNLQLELKRKRPDDYKSFPRGADLLIYFYELALRLLNEEGYNVFITENAWLSTDYGKLFQDFLRTKCEVRAVIDSDYKYFETADINTVITVFRNRQSNGAGIPVRFFHCMGSLKDFPCNTFSNKATDNVSFKQFNSNDAILVSNKWSVVSGSDAKLLDIIRQLFESRSESLSERIAIGQGLNITKNNIVYQRLPNTVPYYTSEIGATYSWEGANCYVKSEVASNCRQKPLLILPRGLGTHFCSINNCGGYTSSYVEVYGSITEAEKLSIWLFCNSSLLWLLREITGRTNLGGGMLKAEATDLRGLPIAFDFDYVRASELYANLRGKSFNTDLSITIQSHEHKSVDDFVLSQLGLTAEKDYIVQALMARVKGRMKKSQSK